MNRRFIDFVEHYARYYNYDKVEQLVENGYVLRKCSSQCILYLVKSGIGRDGSCKVCFIGQYFSYVSSIRMQVNDIINNNVRANYKNIIRIVKDLLLNNVVVKFDKSGDIPDLRYTETLDVKDELYSYMEKNELGHIWISSGAYEKHKIDFSKYDMCDIVGRFLQLYRLSYIGREGMRVKMESVNEVFHVYFTRYSFFEKVFFCELNHILEGGDGYERFVNELADYVIG